MTHTYQPAKPGQTFANISILVRWINGRGLSRAEAMEITGLTKDELSMMVEGRFRQLAAYRVNSAVRRVAIHIEPQMSKFMAPGFMERIYGDVSSPSADGA